MKITNEVGAVLSTLAIDGVVARITEGQLDRKLYVKVNEVLEAIGGKWDRRAKGHVFESDPTTLLDVAIETGSVDRPRDMDFFPTSRALAEKMCRMACVRSGTRMLEPSAGEGVIALEAKRLGGVVTCVEANPKRASVLRGFFHKDDSGACPSVVEADFLSVLPRLPGPPGIKGLTKEWIFDAVVMNPPFSRRQDLAHVEHALKFVKSGGWLISVMSAGVGFRQDARTKAFRDLVRDRGGKITPLPDDTFKEFGTNVRTVLVEMVAGRK